MRKRLSNGHAFTIDRNANQPVPSPLEIRHCRMFELSVTVWTEDEEIAWVMTDLWIKMMYFKVRFTVAFIECERTYLTLSVMDFSKQNPNPGGDPLVALGRTRRYPWTWLARGVLSNLQQLFSG